MESSQNRQVEDILFGSGNDQYDRHDYLAAKTLWVLALELGQHAGAAFHLARMALEANDNPQDAVYLLNLALFLCNESTHQQALLFKASAHHLLGLIEGCFISPTSSYAELLSVATHLQKAIHYDDRMPVYKQHLAQFLERSPTPDIRARLIVDTLLSSFKNGIVKTAAEVMQSIGMTKEQLQVWLVYPDPRDGAALKANQKPATPSELLATHFSQLKMKVEQAEHAITRYSAKPKK